MARPPARGKKGKTKSKALKPKNTSVKAKKPQLPVEVVYAELPNVIRLARQTLTTFWKYRLILTGITTAYAGLTLLLVRGLGSGVNVADLRDEFDNQTLGSVAAFAQLLSNPLGASAPAADAYQLILFIVISLAIIWALRQLLAGQTITVRDAFYRGMTPLVPFSLVLLIIAVQLIPALIGASAYQIAVVAGVATTTIEIVIWAIGALAVTLLSIYFLASSIIALYIATLPDVRPLQAMRMAKTLVRGRRWTVARKMLFLPIILLLIYAIVLIPFIFVLPVVAGWIVFILGLFSLVLAHAYFYNLYQELMNEQQTAN